MKIKSLLFKCSIYWALQKPAPDRIPLSGDDRLRKRDYSTVRLRTKPDNLVFIAYETNRSGVSGLLFPGNDADGLEACFPNRQLGEMKLSITQYFRDQEISYTSAVHFLWCQITLKKYRVWLGHSIGQRLFNLKTLKRSGRLQLLDEIADNSLLQHNYSTGEITFLSEKFGPRARSHPDYDRERRYIRYMFESLTDAGDLEVKNSAYKITGRGFTTLVNAEQEDRKHKQVVLIQVILAILTACLVGVGILQLLLLHG